MLDPRNPDLGASVSRGLVGQRVFVFTDDLDVTNRLFDDVADAEGLWQQRGTYVANPKREPLAALRSPLPHGVDDDEAARFEGGQSWRLADRLGHPPKLTQRLRLDRVSSQDTGVDFEADIVVATASLEVGFDDDYVGAVVQHKAPRDVAQFLQRKGRGGRPQEMRPWTVVTLSDYGRDRAAYQNYDALFDPEVPPQHLPLGNRYVLRMQAASALIDWVAHRVLTGSDAGRHRYFDPYRVLTAPPADQFRKANQDAVAAVLSEVLENPEGPLAAALHRHLREALDVTDDEATALLWEPPRALLTGAAPTLLRRLERAFQREGQAPEPESKQPLPAYIPENLFSDLNLPEVTLHLPPIRRGQYERAVEPAAMAVDRALREFAPGRVSRRFGHTDSAARHWVPVPTDGRDEAAVALDGSVEGVPRVRGDAVGAYQYRDGDGYVRGVPVTRPYDIRLEQTPRDVLTSSHARPRWHTQILPPPDEALLDGARHQVSTHLAWSEVVHEVRFYTHLGRAPVEVRRFTTGADASVRVTQPGATEAEQFNIRTTYTLGDAPAAVGFSQQVDAIAFVVRPPAPETVRAAASDEVRRSLRTAYLRYLVVEGEVLEDVDAFQREWLYRAVLGAAAERVAAGGDPARIGTPDAFVTFRAALVDILDRILEADVDPESGDAARSRHGERLAAVLHDDAVVAELARAVTSAWAPASEAFDAWLRERTRVTLGAALLAACGDLTPGRSEDGLLLDLDSGPTADPEGAGPAAIPGETLWISEATVGGNGLVEAIFQAYTRDPRTFFGGAERALQGSDLELVAAELPRAVRAMVDEEDVREAAEVARRSEGLVAATEANATLRDALARQGVLCTHAVYAALAHRVLRPGSGGETAALVVELVGRWDALETAAGVEVDARVFAHLAGRDDSLASMLGPVPLAYRNDPTWRAGAYATLLWSRGAALRSSSLRPYNPYVTFAPTDRTLLSGASDRSWRSRRRREGGVAGTGRGEPEPTRRRLPRSRGRGGPLPGYPPPRRGSARGRFPPRPPPGRRRGTDGRRLPSPAPPPRSHSVTPSSPTA